MRGFKLLVAALLLCGATSFAEAGQSEIKHQLGDTTVTIKVYENGPGLTYVAVHDDENTSVAAAKQVIGESGGRLLELAHSGERYISFSIEGVKYKFDPNRMFTEKGIRDTLELRGKKYSLEAHLAVRALAHALILYLNDNTLVALHNNSNGSYSIESYLPGGREARNASEDGVHVSKAYDKDDFFFVTARSVFEALKNLDFNVVLQAGQPHDDGSLSVFAGQRGMNYVNSEAQEGHMSEQLLMLRQLNAE